MVLVSLEALEAIHKDWKTGSKLPSKIKEKKTKVESQDLTPKEITAAVIKLKSPITIFKVQREINNYELEPLQAIIPGIVLTKLWQIVSITENIMLAISSMVIVSSIIGMTAILYSNLNSRRKEMALLRIVGASPKDIFTLMMLEAFLISLFSILLSITLVQLASFIFYPLLDRQFGIFLEQKLLTIREFYFLILVLLSSLLVSIFPSIQAFKKSINDGI